MKKTLTFATACVLLPALLSACSGGDSVAGTTSTSGMSTTVPAPASSTTSTSAEGPGSTEPPGDDRAGPFSYELSKAAHPKLDFGLSPRDGLPMIRDFALTPDGNLRILQLSRDVSEYTPDGILVGTCTYPFDERGLTAYMLTCDAEGSSCAGRTGVWIARSP